MRGLRLEIDLYKIRHNTQLIVDQLTASGIRVTAVTKAACGHPAIGRAMLDGGAVGLAESRVRNVKRLRNAGLTCPITLIRTPMLSQVDDVVKHCQASYNTEPEVIAALAASARRQNTVHGVHLMIEMGDQREGIMPHDLGEIAQQVVDMPGVTLMGIGANFACLNGVAPTFAKMRALSDLANDVEVRLGRTLVTVSGGNSANLRRVIGDYATGRVNDLRIGEAILLGVDPITGDGLSGMFQDAFTLVAEVIETRANPMPLSTGGADHSMARFLPVRATPDPARLILAVGHQDTEPAGLAMPVGATFIGATSDHLIVGVRNRTQVVGSEMRFQMNYGALMRAMAAPDIQTNFHTEGPAPHRRTPHDPHLTVALA